MADEHPPRIAEQASLSNFASYYAETSLSKETATRFESIRDVSLRLYRQHGANRAQVLEVADVGCGAGTLSMIWARAGHQVHSIDINQELVGLGRQRAAAEGMAVDFRVGSAVALPWDNASMDICLMPELLEHVADWRSCVSECARLLRPGGLLFLTTTNRLCPKQQEFDLPFYSWYPAPLKRYCEKLSVTTRPELVQHAQYPAVHWFTFYQMRDELKVLGFAQYFDRFDAIDAARKPAPLRALLASVRTVPLLRWLGHVATPNLRLFAIKAL